MSPWINDQRSPRQYKGQAAHDDSRQHNGDVIYNSTYYHSQGQQTLSDALIGTPTGTQIFHVPYPKYIYFRGRDDLLEKMSRELDPNAEQSEHRLKSCLIHAMGGMGKTQIALEYAHRFRRRYDCIFWLGAQHELELQTSFASIALKIRIQGADEMGIERKKGLVKEWLESTNSSWLLVFDNAESWDYLRYYWPNSIKGSVIVTSQVKALMQGGSIYEEIAPKPFDRKDGSQYFLDLIQARKPSNDIVDQTEQISAIVGGLPIAVAHLAGYMYERALQPHELLSKLKTHQLYKIWSSQKTMSTGEYRQRLDMVWAIALEELPNEAMDLLQKLALLSPDEIPEAMLVADKDDTQKESFETVRSYLTKRQLVRRGSGSEPYLSIHRSLQLNIRNTLARLPHRRQQIFNEAVVLVRKAFPQQSDMFTSVYHHWQLYKTYQRHVKSLQDFFKDADSKLESTSVFAHLLSDEARYKQVLALVDRVRK